MTAATLASPQQGSVAVDIVENELKFGLLSSYNKYGIAKLVEQKLERFGFEPRWSCCLKTASVAQAIYLEK